MKIEIDAVTERAFRLDMQRWDTPISILYRVTKEIWFNNDLLAFAQRQAAHENCTLDSYIESLLFRHARESDAAAFGEADSSNVLPFQLPSRM